MITSLITRDLRNGVFSFSQFWERRARRILPALFVLTATLVVASWFLLLPGELTHFGNSVVALSLFSANIYFWRQTQNYFADSTDEYPLLHSWSLAVEEQFYFIIPFALWWIFRSPRLRKPGFLLSLLIVGFVASFGLNVYGISRFAGATFFLLPTRAWELLMGAIVAQAATATRLDRRRGRIIDEVAAGLGMALILIPAFAYSSKTPFPGLAALPPCLGAALVIGVNTGRAPSTIVARLLSLRPVVFIGLISYSLYLWHWPPLAFYRLLRFQAASGRDAGLLVMLSVGIAILSWAFVETPFRKRRFGGTRHTMFAWAAIGIPLLLTCGIAFVVSDGFPKRIPEEAQKFADAALDFSLINVEIKDIVESRLPRIGATDPALVPSILVWGDSHAMAVVPAVEELLVERGLSGCVATYQATPPVLEWYGDKSFLGKSTPQFNRNVLSLIKRNNIPIVLIAGYWTGWAEATSPTLVDFNSALLATVKEVIAAGAEPWILLDVPIPLADVPKRLYRRIAFPSWDVFAIQKTVLQTDPFDNINAATIVAIKGAGGRIYDPKPAFLDSSGLNYVVIKNGDVLYKDGDHLTARGAVRTILPLLREALNDYDSRKEKTGRDSGSQLIQSHSLDGSSEN